MCGDVFMSKCNLIQGDCIVELQKLIEDNVKVDLIVTDPPYMINYKSDVRQRYSEEIHDFNTPILNDDNDDLIIEVLPLLYKILKDDGALYMFCNSTRIDFFKSEIQKIFNYRNILVWIKNNWSMGDIPTTYGKQTEFIVYAMKGRHILRNGRDTDVLFYDRVSGNKQFHQNQKPVPLLEFLISKSSDKGDTVLDAFMGSGSTGVACLQMDRDFIGIELDRKYYEISKKRCKEYQSKLI